jgi:hypothetical protein
MTSLAKPLLAILMSMWACGAAAGLVTEPPAAVDEPRFYEQLRAMLVELSRSEDPILRRLHETARASPAAIRVRPMTDDRSTWNSDGSRTRAHTEPDDRQPKSAGRDKPSDATIFLPPEAVEPGKGFWKSGTLVHELTHAIDLANGRYNPAVAIRERRATFMQNVWRGHTGAALRTSYHGRFPTLDYQEALRRGALEEYARYIFTRSDFPGPPGASQTVSATKDGD